MLTDLRKLLPLTTRNFIAGGILAALVCAAPAVGAYSDVPVTQTYNTVNEQLLSALTGTASSTPISISHDDIRDADRSFIQLEDVDSQAKLVEYVRALMANDPDIQQIELDSHFISMTYESRIRVPYIGRTDVERTVRIRDDGTISVTKPWYVRATDDDRDDGVRDGFSDLPLVAGGSGYTPHTEALLATRLEGRFQIGAL
jgi:hypothetical protein